MPVTACGLSRRAAAHSASKMNEITRVLSDHCCGWWRESSSTARRALVAASCGWMLDSFDVMLYALVVAALIVDLGISKREAGILGSITLIAAAAGGLAFGVIADRFGRIKALIWSVLIYAVFTAACGLARNVVELAIFRILLGFGMGGEWASGAALVAETCRFAAFQRGEERFSPHLSTRSSTNHDRCYLHECLHAVRVVGLQSLGTGVSVTAAQSWWSRTFRSCDVGDGDRDADRHVVRLCQLRISKRLLRAQALLYRLPFYRGIAGISLWTRSYAVAVTLPRTGDGIFRDGLLLRLRDGDGGNL